jgi:hypothetical protein
VFTSDTKLEPADSLKDWKQTMNAGKTSMNTEPFALGCNLSDVTPLNS